MSRRPPRPFHVLLTTDVVGGVWDLTWVLADELIRAGQRVTLLAFGSPTPEHRAQAADIGAALLDAPLKLEWMQDSDGDVLHACELTERLVRDLEPDLLHANQFMLGQLEAGVPTVLTAHSDVLSWLRWVRRRGRGRTIPDEWRRYARLVGDGLCGADAVVAVSHFLAGELAAFYRPGRDVEVIHNGWPLPPDSPAPIRGRVRTTLLAGRVWDCAKNVELAVRAARGWQPGRVLVAGEQRHPDFGTWREVGPPVEMLGRLSREAMDRRLREARVYLAPARYEPFGLLPLQAALAGCPLLLSDIPSFRELWDGAALFFRPDNAADLRRQWARLLADDALAGALTTRARRRALERYGSRRMAAEYLSLYTRVLAAERESVGGLSPHAPTPPRSLAPTLPAHRGRV